MAFICRCNSCHSSAAPSGCNESGARQASQAGPLPVFRLAIVPGLPPTPKPQPMSGHARVDLVLVSLPTPPTKPGPALGNYPPAAKPGTQIAEALSLSTCSETNLQMLLKISMGAKLLSNNESRSTLKARFSELYFGKSNLDYYQFF